MKCMDDIGEPFQTRNTTLHREMGATCIVVVWILVLFVKLYMEMVHVRITVIVCSALAIHPRYTLQRKVTNPHCFHKLTVNLFVH